MSWFNATGNGTRKYFPDILQIGGFIVGSGNNIYSVDAVRFVKTGILGAGFNEYHVTWLNPAPDRRTTTWLNGHIDLDDFQVFSENWEHLHNPRQGNQVHR